MVQQTLPSKTVVKSSDDGADKKNCDVYNNSTSNNKSKWSNTHNKGDYIMIIIPATIIRCNILFLSYTVAD